MAAHSITFNTTSAQEAKLARAFQRANEKRIADTPPGETPPDPWPDIDAWLKAYLFDHVKQFVKDEEAYAAVSRKEAYAAADQATKDQIDALLGL